MGWKVVNPRFEVMQFEQGWYWELINDGSTVASSHVEHLSKEDALDFIRWLKYHLQDVPITGDGVLEL